MIDLKILDLYHQTLKGSIDRELFATAAPAVEKCLMNFVDQEDPAEDLLYMIFQDSEDFGVEDFFGCSVDIGQERQEHQKLLLFMLATAMSAPTQNLTRIFDAYMLFINDHTFQMKDTFQVYADNQLGDIRSLIRLAEPSKIKHMLRLTDVSAITALVDAVANDDLKAYNRLWNVVDHADDWHNKFGTLALFPIDSDSKIHKALIHSDQDRKDLFLAKVFALRKEVENDFTNACCYLRNKDASAPTLFPNHRNCWTAISPTHEPLFYTQKAFAEGIAQDMHRCVRGFFTPKKKLEIRAHEGWDHIDAITQAYLDAGVSAQYLLTHGLCGESEGAPLVSMQQAMGRLGMLDKESLRFYGTTFKALFKDFDTKTLLGYCATDESRQALYAVTQDKDILNLVGDRVRDAMFGSDLGL